MGKQIREQHAKIQKQKERLLRELKRAETQFRHVKDELSSANMTIEKLQLKVNFCLIEKILIDIMQKTISNYFFFQRAAMPTDDTDLEVKRVDLQEDLENLQKTHEKQVCIHFLSLSI